MRGLGAEIAASAAEALTFAETLADARLVGPLSLRQARAVEPIILNLQRLRTLVQDLQEQNLETDAHSLAPERLDPQQALTDAIAGLSDHILKANVQLVLPSRVPGLAVLADVNDLTRAFADMIRLGVDLAGRGQDGGMVTLDWTRQGFVAMTLCIIGAQVTSQEMAALERSGGSLAQLSRRAGRMGAAFRASLMPDVGVRMVLTLPGLGDDRPWPAPMLREARQGVVLYVGVSGPERALMRLHCDALGGVRLHGGAPGEDGLMLAGMLSPHLTLVDLDDADADRFCAEVGKVRDITGGVMVGLTGRAVDAFRSRQLRRQGVAAVLKRPLRSEDIEVLLKRSLPLADASQSTGVRG